jgi:membrane peptidoglycan carboxypeptidase
MRQALLGVGSGLTTLTQSLGKRVGFADFQPGWRKFRLRGYARGLKAGLDKQQILTLHLDRVSMGRDREGRWMTGLFTASERIFGMPPAALPQREFLALVAVSIAPSRLRLASPSADLAERVDRIERLVQRRCTPVDLRDVWLEGCARPA